MPFAVPQALEENADLAFLGEAITTSGSIPEKLAERMLAARNPHGKPNADVLRQLVTAANPLRPGIQWQIDFPSGMDERTASLYELPFQHLLRSVQSAHTRWWVNVRADDRLRTALARRDRFLATPLSSNPPTFTWFDSSTLPDDTLLVVARDDDFIHGMLQSHLFALWWGQVHTRRSPTLAVASFPFPWPPSTTLSALSATREEKRYALARAARAGNSEQINAAAVAAYAWPADLADEEYLARLHKLYLKRAR